MCFPPLSNLAQQKGSQKAAALRVVPQGEKIHLLSVTTELAPQVKGCDRKEARGNPTCISGLRKGKAEKWERKEDISPSYPDILT